MPNVMFDNGYRYQIVCRPENGKEFQFWSKDESYEDSPRMECYGQFVVYKWSSPTDCKHVGTICRFRKEMPAT
jgi:hypothetical protein